MVAVLKATQFDTGMGLESPTTKSWDEQEYAHKEDVPTNHGRRSAHLDLNLAVTRDETDGDDYYKEDMWSAQTDMDVDGGDQQVCPPLTRNPNFVGSPSPRVRSRSVSPPSRLSLSPARKEFSSVGERQVDSYADDKLDYPGRFARRSHSPPRQKSPFSLLKTPLGSSPPAKERSPSTANSPLRSPSPVRQESSPVRQRSLSPGRFYPRSPSPVRHGLTSPERTPLRSSPPVRRRSPSPVRTDPRSPSPVRQRLTPLRRTPLRSPSSPVRQKSPSQRLPSPGRQRSLSPLRTRQRLPPSPRRDVSPPTSRHNSTPTRHRSPSARKYSSQDVQRDISSSPSRHRSPPRRRSPPPRRRCSPRDIQQSRDRSLSRSPIRRRDSYAGSGRGYRRSRSPMARDHYPRSPRGRYSPRRRTPPRDFRSYRRSPRRRPWSPPPNRSTGVGKPGNNLFIAGFSFLTTERDLEKKFSRFGRVTDVRIVRDKRSGDSRGFGFLSLEKDEDADAAIRALDQTQWNGRVVLVEKSKTSAR